jgi:hypothetical protein
MTADAWSVQVLQAWGDTEKVAVRATVLHLVCLKAPAR